MHGCLLLLELISLKLFAFLGHALLFGDLTKFNFVKSRVPVDTLLIIQFLLGGVVGNNERFRSANLDSLKAILLNELPGELFLVLPRHAALLGLYLFGGLNELV